MLNSVLQNLKEKATIWKENQEMPILTPMSKDNVILITAYLNQGNVVVTYKGDIRKGHFDKGILKRMVKGGDEIRKRDAIGTFVSAVAQLVLSLSNK